MSEKRIDKAADNIRMLAAAMVEKAKSGHPGGAMGGADFVNVLYSEFLRYDPEDPAWFFRDRFFLDPGHMSPMLYGVLTLCGMYSLEDIQQFRQWDSPTPGHPELNPARGVENTSGPLGQGHCMALGTAIVERFLVERFGEWMAHKTYAFISDGGVQEEISQGVGRLAGHLGLSNFIMFYDSNGIQLSHKTDEVTHEDTAKKYEAWGWRVETINGNDAGEIRDALKRANEETEKPTLIIGKTIMGRGCLTEAAKSFEGQSKTHGMPLSKAGACIKATIKNLGGDPENPFQIFDESKELYAQARDEKIKAVKAFKEKQAAWEKENPELAGKLKKFISGDLPEIDFSAIEQKADSPTRSASGAVLGALADKVENMIVCSADLSDSDNTNSFLKKTTAFTKGDYSGKFLQAGVSELTMAGVANGMTLHGGVFAACGTFFVFSDYMKPAVRLSALMGLPVKFIWTHDAFRVGEDGPTHQPVEQEAQIRLLEKMNNLEGKRSTLVLRPADAVETSVAWKLALEHTDGPTALIFSRQPIPSVPTGSGKTRYEEALDAARGAYIVKNCEGKPDIILLANGSEVSTLIEATPAIESEMNLRVRVVSAISEGLFQEQSDTYREEVLPFGVPVFGLTAGLPVTLQGLVGPLGKVVGMDRFGASAPYNVLDEKFGYTPQAVVPKVAAYLGEYRKTLAKMCEIAK